MMFIPRESGRERACSFWWVISQLLRAAFKASRKLTCRNSGNSNLQLELAVLSLLQAIAAVATSQKAPADTRDVMSKRLVSTADELLKCSWRREDEAEEESATGDMSACPFRQYMLWVLQVMQHHEVHGTGLMQHAV